MSRTKRAVRRVAISRSATRRKPHGRRSEGSEDEIRSRRRSGVSFVPSNSRWYFVGGAKYDAWSKLKGMSKDEAMQNYIKQVDRLNRD